MPLDEHARGDDEVADSHARERNDDLRAIGDARRNVERQPTCGFDKPLPVAARTLQSKGSTEAAASRAAPEHRHADLNNRPARSFVCRQMHVENELLDTIALGDAATAEVARDPRVERFEAWANVIAVTQCENARRLKRSIMLARSSDSNGSIGIRTSRRVGENRVRLYDFSRNVATPPGPVRSG